MEGRGQDPDHCLMLGDPSPQCGGLALLEKMRLREEGSPGPKFCDAEQGRELSQSKEAGGQKAAVYSPKEPPGGGRCLQGRAKLAPI